jgi:phosphatidylinositol dimannoside acyltransferase
MKDVGSWSFGGAAASRTHRAKSATTRDVLRALLPDKPASEIDVLVRQNAAYTMRYYKALLRLPHRSYRRTAQRGVRVENLEALSLAVGSGRGVVLVAPHMGQFELAASWVVEEAGVPLVAPVGSCLLRLQDWIQTRARTASGIETHAVQHDSVPTFAGALRRGGVVAILADRPSPGRGMGVRILNQSATLSTAAAVLAARTKALVLLASTYTDEDGADVLRFGDPIAPASIRSEGKAAVRVTHAIASWLGESLQTAPSQWHVPAQRDQVILDRVRLEMPG